MQDNEKMMREFLGYWSTRDADAMADMFAENGIYDNVPEKSPLQGRKAIGDWLKIVFDHLTRIDVDLLRITVDGEWLMAERLDDHIAGDKHMPLPVMNVSRIVDGKIVLFRDYYCRQTVKDLGMA